MLKTASTLRSLCSDQTFPPSQVHGVLFICCLNYCAVVTLCALSTRWQTSKSINSVFCYIALNLCWKLPWVNYISSTVFMLLNLWVVTCLTTLRHPNRSILSYINLKWYFGAFGTFSAISIKDNRFIITFTAFIMDLFSFMFIQNQYRAGRVTVKVGIKKS